MNKIYLVITGFFFLTIFIEADVAQQGIPKSKALLIKNVNIADKYISKAEMFTKSASYDSAVFYYEKAGTIYKNAQKIDKYTTCLNKISEQWLSLGSIDKAKKYAHDALKLGLKYANLEEIGGSYNAFGYIYFTTGQLDSAVVNFKKALAVCLKNKQARPTSIATVYSNIAFLDDATGNYNEAIDVYIKAINLLKAKKSENSETLVAIYNNVATSFQKKGFYKEAIAYYYSALEMALLPKNRDQKQIATLNGNIGNYLRENNDDLQAEIHLNKALSIFEALSLINDPGYAICYCNMGVLKTDMKLYPEALSCFNKAISILPENKGHESILASFYNNLSKLYVEQGKPDIAESFSLKAISLLEKASPGSPNIAIFSLNLGRIYCNAGNPEKGQQYYQQALKINKSLYWNKHPNTAAIYYSMGEAYIKQGKYRTALPYLQNSLIANCLNFEDNNIFHNPTPDKKVLSKNIMVSCLDAKAKSLYKLYATFPDSLKLLELALSTNEIAIQSLDMIHQEFKTEDAKILIDNKNTQVYSSGIHYAYLLYHKTGNPKYLEKAFTYSEKSRSAVLFSALKELEARNIGGIPDSVQSLERSLSLDLAFYSKCIQEEKARKAPDQKKIKLWQNMQFSLNHSCDSLIRSLEKKYPQYYQLKYDLKISGINEIQTKLGEKDVVIEYALAEKMIYTFIISPYTVTFIGTAVDSSFYRNIDLFRKMILYKDISDLSATNYSVIAFKLYESLVKRIEPLVKNKNLIIIPDGKLGTIPFEALLTDNGTGKNKNFKSLPYLIKSHAIGYDYSATIYLQSLKMKNRSSKTGILAFAPSFKARNPSLLAELKERGEEYVSLSGSKDEVNNIQQLYGGKVFMDTAATKANFLQFSPQYSILHISTHGIMNDEKPMQSKLVFYQKNDHIDDANLYAYEIFNMKLKADLIVLSACNTGFGKIEAGEGIMSLARGFMYAGVPSIISTLWSVNDQSTADIMKEFYKYLNKKDDKPVALQKAQLDYINGADNITSHPFYWSGFISIGNNQPVYGPSVFIKWGIPAIILIMIIFAFLWLKWKRKVNPE